MRINIRPLSRRIDGKIGVMWLGAAIINMSSTNFWRDVSSPRPCEGREGDHSERKNIDPRPYATLRPIMFTLFIKLIPKRSLSQIYFAGTIRCFIRCFSRPKKPKAKKEAPAAPPAEPPAAEVKDPTPQKEAKAKKEPAPKKEKAAPAKAKKEPAPKKAAPAAKAKKETTKKAPAAKKAPKKAAAEAAAEPAVETSA